MRTDGGCGRAAVAKVILEEVLDFPQKRFSERTGRRIADVWVQVLVEEVLDVIMDIPQKRPLMCPCRMSRERPLCRSRTFYIDERTRVAPS